MRPTSRLELGEYCLRKLGFPVIDINVDEDQLDDRIDDALQKYSEFHFDGTTTDYMVIKMSAEMLANAKNTQSTTANVASGANNYTVTDRDWQKTYGWIPFPDSVIGVRRIFPLSSSVMGSGSGSSFNMFDLTYQLRLNELYEFTSSSYQYYWIARTHIRMLELLLVGQNMIRFNRKMNRLYIDMNWQGSEIPEDKYFVIECYKALEPEEFPRICDDSWLKEYTTQLIKRQWGENLKKYGNYTLPGGMIINGQVIWQEAYEEIQRLEVQLRDTFEEPPMFEVG